MSLKFECHLNLTVTQDGVSLKLEPHSDGKTSVKLEHHSNWNFTQIEMSLKLESYSNWKVTQIGMSLKSERH